jgi:glycosyltransferase involved in cell wall biosynthesis
MKHLVTIVIPCKNEEKYIDNLFADLYFQKNMGRTRIIVADAHSSDSTRSIINKWADVLNIELIDGGTVSYGRNAGAALATTPYILFIDADVQFFSNTAITDTLRTMMAKDFHLMTLQIKNYGNDVRASMLFYLFNIINKIMTKKTPFAIGAFFLTKRCVFQKLGGFPDAYETSEDYILSKQYNPSRFAIGSHYFGQDERRFNKLGYWGMIRYMVVNFFNRHNIRHFEKATVNYWD